MPRMKSLVFAAIVSAVACSASGQLRVVAWNISNYAGGREADFKTAAYATFEGRSLSPDILMVQEVTSLTGATSLLTFLNSAAGSPGDWSMFTFVNGPDTDNSVYFRTSKIRPVNPPGLTDPDGFPDPILVVPGGNTSGAPRHVHRYDVRLVGYEHESTVISLYSVHMKAGSSSTDQARRLDEATKIRADMAALPSAWNFAIGGDFNIQSSSQAAYQKLIGLPAEGRVFDPISTPGSWNNNGAFRFVHTQDPVGAGGMDDRHDQILVSAGLVNGTGIHYIGSFGTPYSTTTWNDVNHSYRSYGNDGTSFDVAMTIAGNQMVGASIAQALVNLCVGAGHLPVLMDFRVPARVGSPSSVDFGDVYVGELASATLPVFNAGDVSVWSAQGIETLAYTLSASAGFGAPGGGFTGAAGGGNLHTLSMETTEPGEFSGDLVIASNDPDQPTRIVTLTGRVWCRADFDRSGFTDVEDYTAFVLAFEEGDDSADFDGSGFVDIEDFSAFVLAFEDGC